jgi:hypothetical protein
MLKRSALYIFFLTLAAGASAQGFPGDTSNYLSSGRWDNYSLWSLSQNSGVSSSKNNFAGLHNDGIYLTYTFPKISDWIDLSIALPGTFNRTNSISFFIKSSVPGNNLELKFTDTDGTVYRRMVPLSNYTEWKHVVIYLGDTEYAWGGNSTFNKYSRFSIAISGSGSGTLWLDEMGVGLESLPSSFPSSFDNDSTLTGFGFKQRRDSLMTPEDPLVLKYLEVIQDISSSSGDLLPAQEDDQAQTFNNSLVAIAYIVKDERERAERILDYYLNATDTSNNDIQLQNFYYKGEARGFYQWVSLSTRRAPSGTVDRWIGDMAWLLIACKNYELKYDSDRYDKLVKIIKDLMLSFYKEAPKGGYIQSGWRKGDTYLHENTGHHEGNIDCYVALKLCGENFYAQKIKQWLINELGGKTGLPLDLYTWRTLAFGKNYTGLLNIPEYDFRYRKIIPINGSAVMGFYHGPDITVNNFWNDGTGHIACAYLAFGDTTRGYFYSNQLDHLIIPRIIDGDTTHTIPYTFNKTGGYDWVDPNKGFVSCAAWYILSKNSYNPYLSGNFTDTIVSINEKNNAPSLLNVHPNPFSNTTLINYDLRKGGNTDLSVFNLSGEKITGLFSGYSCTGKNSIVWNADNSARTKVIPGMYLLRLSVGNYNETLRVTVIE